jgi:peroxiredoxin
LADFQGKIEKFNEIGTQVVALSVDSEEEARQTAERCGLTYPVLYDLDAREMASTIGAAINEDPPYLHSTEFVLRSEGTIATAVYSTGPIGRLAVDDTMAMIQHYQKHGI